MKNEEYIFTGFYCWHCSSGYSISVVCGVVLGPSSGFIQELTSTYPSDLGDVRVFRFVQKLMRAAAG